MRSGRGRPRRSEVLARQLAAGEALTEGHVSVFVLRALVTETDALITNGELRGILAAEHCIDLANQLGELRAEAHMQRAAACRLLGCFTAAFQDLEIAEQIGGEVLLGSVLRRRACVYADLGEFDEALTLSQQALSLTAGQEYGLALATLAAVHTLRGEFRTALPYYEAALQHPDLAEYQLAALLTNYTFTVGKLPDKAQDGLQLYELVRSRLSDRAKVPRGKCWWGMGICYTTLGDGKKALRSMKIALRILQGLDREVALLLADIAELSACTEAFHSLASKVLVNIKQEFLIEPLNTLSVVDAEGLPEALTNLRKAARFSVLPPQHRPARLLRLPVECEGSGCHRPPVLLADTDSFTKVLCRRCAAILPGASPQLGRRRGRPRRSEAIARELVWGGAIPQAGVTVFVLRAMIAEIDALITQGELQGLHAAQRCVEIAGQLGELRAEAHMQRAAGHRLAGNYNAAFKDLLKAEDLGGKAARGAILRRRACVYVDLGDYDEALSLARKANELTSGREHALTLATLAGVHTQRSEFRTALPFYEAALQQVGLLEDYQLNALLTNYTFALSKLPGHAGEALKRYDTVRRQLGETQQLPRAKCWWGIGRCYKALGDDMAAWRSLNFAKRSLEALSLDRELSLLISDMAEVSASAVAVRALAAEALEKISDGGLALAFKALVRVTEANLPDAVEELRKAAHSPFTSNKLASKPRRPPNLKTFDIPTRCIRCSDRPPVLIVWADNDKGMALCWNCA